MAVQIIQDFIPPGRRNRPGYKLEPRYITVHDTANAQTGADARAHANYLKSHPNLEASWHFTVDDRVIYQHLPLNENGWHAGDGASGTGNRQSIGIEICENRDGNRAAAEANAAWLCAKLLGDFSLDLERIKQHNFWSGKNCPRVLRGRPGGWEGFLKQVEANMELTPIAGPAQVTVEQAQEWARKRGAHQRFLDVAPIYWKYGKLTGIRPEVLYAQSAKETNFGKFTGKVQPEMHNWAGIKKRGASGDRTEDHETFPTDDDGVRAHANHMTVYVGLPAVGEPHGRYYDIVGASWAGQIKYVEQLGGNPPYWPGWAPNPNYGHGIVALLKDMLATKAPGEPGLQPPGPELPSITRTIDIHLDGKNTDEIGYLIDNATYVRASYLIALIGGQVTGHGDYIDIVLPAKPGQAELEELRKKLKTAESDIAALQTALAAERQRIENAKRLLKEAERALG